MFGLGFGSKVTCPHCNKESFVGPMVTTTARLASAEEGVAFLIEHAGSRNWQSLWAKLTTKFTITTKENT